MPKIWTTLSSDSYHSLLPVFCALISIQLFSITSFQISKCVYSYFSFDRYNDYYISSGILF